MKALRLCQCAAVVVVALIIGVTSQNDRNFSEKEILDMLLENYDNELRPGKTVNGTGGPVHVRVNLLIRSINRVDDVSMSYDAQITLRLEWNDPRLAHTQSPRGTDHLSLSSPGRLWKPDIFFQNERSAHFHNILQPNMLTRIRPNGDVLMSMRMTASFACPMDLRMFPMDRQICEIRMASYGWTSNDIIVEWKTSQDPHFRAVQLATGLSMPRFIMVDTRVGSCESQTSSGTYACIKAGLLLQRMVSYYILQVYLPTAMLVLVSFISFWFDAGATTARVLIGVMTLLTMATTNSGINSQLPPVAYTKAIDVWCGVCIFFIFASLLELASVHYYSRDERRRQTLRIDNEQPLLTEQYSKHKTLGLQIPSGRAHRLDFLSRIGFPLAFLLFNILYWSIYLASVRQWPDKY